MNQVSIEKLARLEAALPFLSEKEVAARLATFSESEKTAFYKAIIQAAKPVLSSMGGAIANIGRAGGQAAGMAGQAAKPGIMGRMGNALGLGLGVMGAGSAFAEGSGMTRQNSYDPFASKYASLSKRALSAGLHDAIDLAGYGALMAGPVAEIAAPHWAEEHRKALLGADLAGLGVLTRHHIGLGPEHLNPKIVSTLNQTMAR